MYPTRHRLIRCGHTLADNPERPSWPGVGRWHVVGSVEWIRGGDESVTAGEPTAWLGGLIGTGLVESADNLAATTSTGRWSVVMDFDGRVRCHRFASWRPGAASDMAGPWQGPAAGDYRTSLDRQAYEAAVESVREDIADGRLYQANICRVLSARVSDASRADILGLAALLEEGNPSPYAGAIRIPDEGLEVATASPELFISLDGRTVSSGPIKGTASRTSDLSEKDRAENVMIVDLVRNDLSRVCEPGSVEVPSLLRIEHHPTIVHLVSTISGILRPDIGLASIAEAAFPPGSVTGAPKYTALQVISELEPSSRGPYCGAIGWVDADAGTAQLAVAIRTFWKTEEEGEAMLHFGTGAGITWGSDAAAEWDESVLKAEHLISVAAGEKR